MFRPRTIRGQLLAALLLFEVLLVGVFAFFLVRQHQRELKTRERRRLEYQSSMLALMVQDAIADNRRDLLQKAISQMMLAPSIRAVQITDMQGRTIFASDASLNGRTVLKPGEQRYINSSPSTVVLDLSGGKLEAVAPVIVNGQRTALSWVYPNEDAGRDELLSQLRLTLAFGLIGAVGSVLLAEFLARSVTRPLSRLLLATRKIIRDPVDTSTLPTGDNASSEVADLTLAFNLMVASIEEQRSGLNDTLGLLDSMLAHAPIGIAFFDNHTRFIRLNQFLADMSGPPISKHIGRGIEEIWQGARGELIAQGVQQVFTTTQPIRDLEISLEKPEEDGRFSTWLVNVYPVRMTDAGVRWVGAVIVDTTGIKRSEEALRRTEKLAAVGRLSSSIAHEINNPLEAITNLLYLLRQIDGLSEQAATYVELATHELSRMSEIVQQTLRFHRQSTRPASTNIGEILDAVLSLNRGKIRGLQVEVHRRFEEDVRLFCFAGEMRQLFANLIGNALDALPSSGGILAVSVRYSRSWKDPSVKGIRVTVADTGSGMSPATQRRIFEPFFTTKEATGTGLGLWVSSEIIHKHKGHLSLRSRSSEDRWPSGTVFMLFFPGELSLSAHQAGHGASLKTTA